MLKTIKNLFIITIIIFSVSCKDQITNNYLQQAGGAAPDVNIYYSSYSLETVHSFHMDTTAYPEYNYCINLNLKLDKPQNRNQINKIIIVNEDGFGWEFFSDELESFYSETFSGYELKNLIFEFYGTYPSSQSFLYKVKLYSKSNKASAEYEFILLPNFISSQSNFSHGWYTQNVYQLNFDYYYSSIYTSNGEVVWLNQHKQYTGNSEFNNTSLENNGNLRLNNIPGNAYYFYLFFQKEENGIKSSIKTSIYPVEDRFPDNIQILGEYIYNMDVVKYVREIQKILILDRSYNNLYIIDYTTMNLEKKITLNNSPYSIAYSGYDNKIYVGFQNGRLYSMGLTDASPVLVKNLGSNYIYSMVGVNKYLVISCYNNTFRILNLETNSVTVETNYNYYSCRNLVYNNTYNVLYGSTGYEMVRFNFDPESGTLSDYKMIYTGSSNYYELLLYPDDSKIVSPGGNIYNCSVNSQNDLTSYGNLGHSLASASFSADNSSIIALHRGYYSSEPDELIIYNKNNFEQIGFIENFWGDPRYIIVEGDVVKVISYYSSKIAAELFSYSDIISGGKLPGRNIKTKYYLSGKL